MSVYRIVYDYMYAKSNVRRTKIKIIGNHSLSAYCKITLKHDFGDAVKTKRYLALYGLRVPSLT